MQINKCIEPAECDCDRLRIFLEVAATVVLFAIAVASKNQAAAAEAAAAIGKAIASSKAAVKNKEIVGQLAIALSMLGGIQEDNMSLEKQMQGVLDEMAELNDHAFGRRGGFGPDGEVIIIPPEEI